MRTRRLGQTLFSQPFLGEISMNLGEISMNLTIQEIAQAVGSECSALTKITNVEFDSRKITEGSLFVPLAGTRDGHEFIQQAITNGASASFWSLPVEQAPKNFPVIPVADPLKAMQQLATYYLEKVGAEVVAITGSNGKTTTKDLTASVLSEKLLLGKSRRRSRCNYRKQW